MKTTEIPVADYMTKSPHSIGADQPVSVARSKMREHGVRHLPVLRSGRLVGIVTERDLAWIENVGVEGRTTLVVDDAMTPYPYLAAPSTPLREVAAMMAKGKFGAAIIADKNEVVGVFTTTDAMRALSDALDPRAPAARAGGRGRAA